MCSVSDRQFFSNFKKTRNFRRKNPSVSILSQKVKSKKPITILSPFCIKFAAFSHFFKKNPFFKKKLKIKKNAIFVRI